MKNSERKLEMYSCLFSELISLCKNYLSEEDLAVIISKDVQPPLNILKQNSDIQFNCISLKDCSNENAFYLLHPEALDFLIVIDYMINEIENIEPVFKTVGVSIKSGGILAFTYERINSSNSKKVLNSLLSVKDDLKSIPINDGVLQKLLIDNNFYIQYEIEYLPDSLSDSELVLIIAQKK